MRRVISNELHVFFTRKNAPFVPTTAHGVKSSHISRVHVASQNSCTFSPRGTKKHRCRKSFCILTRHAVMYDNDVDDDDDNDDDHGDDDTRNVLGIPSLSGAQAGRLCLIIQIAQSL